MGIFSRIKSVFTGGARPKRAAPAAMADYNGVSTTRYYGQKSAGGLPQPTPTLMLDSEHSRLQVRTLSHTSLQLRALLERDTDTVIAQGLNLAPEPKYKILGITPEAAKEWIAGTKTRFELWAMSAGASRSARYNFFQAQRLMRKSLYRDGELFVALSYHNDPALLSPLRFELLDPDQIRERGFTWTANGRTVDTLCREGIIRNADGEETAYKVWVTDSYGLPRMTEIPRVGRGGRVMMLHAITGMDYAGQLRGVSPLAVCVHDLENILDFTLAQVDKAKHQSNIIFTLESDTDEPPDGSFMQLSSMGAKFGSGIAARQYGENPMPADEAKGVTEEPLEPVCTSIPHTEFTRPGSYGVIHTKGRDRLKPFPDTSPSSAFNVFVDAYSKIS